MSETAHLNSFAQLPPIGVFNRHSYRPAGALRIDVIVGSNQGNPQSRWGQIMIGHRFVLFLYSALMLWINHASMARRPIVSIGG